MRKEPYDIGCYNMTSTLLFEVMAQLEEENEFESPYPLCLPIIIEKYKPSIYQSFSPAVHYAIRRKCMSR
jgi:hypothetical protein